MNMTVSVLWRHSDQPFVVAVAVGQKETLDHLQEMAGDPAVRKIYFFPYSKVSGLSGVKTLPAAWLWLVMIWSHRLVMMKQWEVQILSSAAGG